jgi:hypothetical protein
VLWLIPAVLNLSGKQSAVAVYVLLGICAVWTVVAINTHPKTTSFSRRRRIAVRIGSLFLGGGALWLGVVFFSPKVVQPKLFVSCTTAPIPISEQRDEVELVDPALSKAGGWVTWFPHSAGGRPPNYPTIAGDAIGKSIYRCEASPTVPIDDPGLLTIRVWINETYWDTQGKPGTCVDNAKNESTIKLPLPRLIPNDKLVFYIYNSTNTCIRALFGQYQPKSGPTVAVVDQTYDPTISLLPMVRRRSQ